MDMEQLRKEHTPTFVFIDEGALGIMKKGVAVLEQMTRSGKYSQEKLDSTSIYMIGTSGVIISVMDGETQYNPSVGDWFQGCRDIQFKEVTSGVFEVSYTSKDGTSYQSQYGSVLGIDKIMEVFERPNFTRQSAYVGVQVA